ncbi:hypothetical protein G6F24_018059 [Rhizopus arrhizus]|nr:hypothetical protein G6F24_018059 [Rhizopus arrhizus]
MDRGDVAQPDGFSVHPDQRVRQRAAVLELAGGAHEDAVVGGRQGAGAGHRVLRIDRLGDLLRRDAQPGQLRVGDFDVDVLGLVGKVVHLGHSGHAQQHRAQLVRIVYT